MRTLNFIALGLLLLLPLLTQAQKQVGQNVKLENATIIEFKEPFQEMVIYFEDEEDNRHGLITIQDTTLFVKKSAFNKRKKNVKPDEIMQASDFRAGMKINLQVDYYQISQQNMAVRICLDEKYYGQTSITGLYERLEGEKAIIDGQAVMLALDKGKSIEGREEWKGKKFTSFNDMQLGSEVQVWGERKTDGIIYASRGINRPAMMSKEDYLLRKATDQETRVTKGVLTIAGAWQFRFVTNTEAEAYISGIGRQLIPQYLRDLKPDHPDHIAFKFYLVDDQSFNAASYPNGAVVIHKGLLTSIENEAQLAAILGHEIAHVTQKHHASQFRRHKNWDAVKSFGEVVATTVVINNVANGVPVSQQSIAMPLAVLTAAAEMSVSSFNQKQESQADRIGLSYMVNAGYDPREAALIWKKLADEAKDDKQQGQQLAAMNWLQKSFKSDAATQQAAEANIERVRKEREAQSRVKTEEQPLFPSHPDPRSRFTHVNFLISTAYASIDYATTKTNADKFKNIVRLIGGRPAIITKPMGSSKKNTPKPKPKKA